MGKIYSVDSSDMVSSLRVATLYLPECRSVMIAVIPISIDVTCMGMCVMCVDCCGVCATVVMIVLLRYVYDYCVLYYHDIHAVSIYYRM